MRSDSNSSFRSGNGNSAFQSRGNGYGGQSRGGYGGQSRGGYGGGGDYRSNRGGGAPIKKSPDDEFYDRDDVAPRNMGLEQKLYGSQQNSGINFKNYDDIPVCLHGLI